MPCHTRSPVSEISDCDSSRLFRDAISNVKKFHEIASKLCEFYYFSDIVPRVSLIWLRMCRASVIQYNSRRNVSKISQRRVRILQTYAVRRRRTVFRDIRTYFCAKFVRIFDNCDCLASCKLSSDCRANVVRLLQDVTLHYIEIFNVA